MIIHVVEQGDSLWRISRRYGVSVQEIMEVNRFSDLPYLIPGQAIVIPVLERAYRVKPGDTLWSIGRRFDVPVQRIAALNGITDPRQLYVGQILRIPHISKGYGIIEVNAYVNLMGTRANLTQIRREARHLTYGSIFSYTFRTDGSLIGVDDQAVLDIFKQNRVAPLLVLGNFTEGNFDRDLGHTLLASENIQDILINNLLDVMGNKGYYGLSIDFEDLPPEDRSLYNNFLRRLVRRLHQENFIVTTALVPKPYEILTGHWGAHDYEAHGEIVDFVTIMAYDWGWAGGPPFAVAPINEVRNVLNYAISVIPRQKILMGIALYGYDWKLPYDPEGEWASYVSQSRALNRAATYGAVIQFNRTAQAPYFYYTTETGQQHIVWFEDARSIQAKLRLIAEYNLRGASYWSLELSHPQNWALLEDMFTIRKVV